MSIINTVDFDEHSVLGKLLRSLGPFGFIAIDESRVNIHDLASYKPGAIVRVQGNPDDCIRVFAMPDAITLGCVAGWISDEA